MVSMAWPGLFVRTPRISCGPLSPQGLQLHCWSVRLDSLWGQLPLQVTAAIFLHRHLNRSLTGGGRRPDEPMMKVANITFWSRPRQSRKILSCANYCPLLVEWFCHCKAFVSHQERNSTYTQVCTHRMYRSVDTEHLSGSGRTRRLPVCFSPRKLMSLTLEQQRRFPRVTSVYLFLQRGFLCAFLWAQHSISLNKSLLNTNPPHPHLPQ